MEDLDGLRDDLGALCFREEGCCRYPASGEGVPDVLPAVLIVIIVVVIEEPEREGAFCSWRIIVSDLDMVRSVAPELGTACDESVPPASVVEEGHVQDPGVGEEDVRSALDSALDV